MKLTAFQELGMLICLIDGCVSIHDLHSYSQLYFIEKSKGAVDFTAKLNTDKDGKLELHLCIAIKKRLLLLNIKDKRVNDICPNRELTFPEAMRRVHWVGEKSIVVATRVEYHLFSDVRK